MDTISGLQKPIGFFVAYNCDYRNDCTALSIGDVARVPCRTLPNRFGPIRESFGMWRYCWAFDQKSIKGGRFCV